MESSYLLVAQVNPRQEPVLVVYGSAIGELTHEASWLAFKVEVTKNPKRPSWCHVVIAYRDLGISEDHIDPLEDVAAG